MIAPPFKSTTQTSSSESEARSNNSVSPPLPETYFATSPLHIFNRGLPLTVTASLKTSAICLPLARNCRITGPDSFSESHLPLNVQAAVICSGFGEPGAYQRLFPNQ